MNFPTPPERMCPECNEIMACVIRFLPFAHWICLKCGVEVERGADGALITTWPLRGEYTMNDDDIRRRVLTAVLAERYRQTQEIATAEIDDKHTQADWIAIAVRQLGLAANDNAAEDDGRFRRQMVRLGAVALAALEATERRKMKPEKTGESLLTVRLLETVTLTLPAQGNRRMNVVALKDSVMNVHVDPSGNVSAIFPDGLLRLKPSEFQWINPPSDRKEGSSDVTA